LTAALKNHYHPRYCPERRFASRGSLLPGKVVAGLPVMALNVDNIDVNFPYQTGIALRLRQPVGIPQFPEQLGVGRAAEDGRSGLHRPFDLNPARNTREKLLLPLADIKPLQEPGVYIAVMNRRAATAIATPRRCSPSAISAYPRTVITTGWMSLPRAWKTARRSPVSMCAAERQRANPAQAKSDARGT
jgi:uncharacterized protein YfaS (alpha-2-macroglobulin family)